MPFWLKYLASTIGIGFTIANFIACGSHYYQVIADEEPKNPSYHLIKGVHAAKGWIHLPINVSFGEDMSQEDRKSITNAMTTWENALGITLFNVIGTHTGVSGDSFENLYGSLEDGVNGYYSDFNWQKTKKPMEVLGTAIWLNNEDGAAITTADIRFNRQTYLIGNSHLIEKTDQREVVDLETLALHELGHLLGLSHISESDDSFSVMNPAIYIGSGLTSRSLSLGDQQRIQQIYGCFIEECP